jgi:putative ABC transport system permease protein
MGRNRLGAGIAGVLTNLVAAVGMLIGLRAIVTIELPRPSALLGLEPLAREGLSVAWSSRAVWPADLQLAAVDRLVGLIAALALVGVGVAALNAWILLAESTAARRRDLTVRAAIGVSPRRMVSDLVGEIRTVLVAALGLGLVTGLGAGAAARAFWPGSLESAATLDAVGSLFVPLAGLAAIMAVAHVGLGLHISLGRAGWQVLRAGSHATADAGAVFFRRVAPAVHIAMAGTVLVGALAVSGGIGPRSEGSEGDTAANIMVIAATSPTQGGWMSLLGELESGTTLAAESLASPGALVGLGVRDFTISQCGNCSKGLMPAPLWGAMAEHHSVTPGFFELAGFEVMSGRTFDAGDDEASELVAVINQTFAYTAFEKGLPLGKKVRIGTTHDRWYTVVGVVDDVRVTGPGQDELPRSMVYLSGLQQPVRSGHLLVRGSESAVAEAVGLMQAGGFSPHDPLPLAAVRAEAGRVFHWLRALAASLGILVLILAAYGVHTTALQVTRRRAPDLAIRRAIGATNRRIVTHVVRERILVGLWGVFGMLFFGTMFVAFVRRAAGVPAVSAQEYLLVGALLLLVSVLASLKAAREALNVEPASLMD